MVRHPMKGVHSGDAGLYMALLRTLNPGGFDRVAAKAVRSDHLADRPAEPTPGNLWDPMPQHTGGSGGWGSNAPALTPAVNLRLWPLVLAVVGGVGLAGTGRLLGGGAGRFRRMG